MDKKSSVSNNGAVVKIKKHRSSRFFKSIGWYFAVLIVILLIVIMAVPSISIFSERGRGNGYTFGKFANKKIEFTDGSFMLYAYNGIMQQYSQWLDNTQLQNMQMSIMQQAFQSAAVATGTSYFAEKSNMVITDEAVNDYIKKNYVDESGNFNRSNWAKSSESERNRVRRFAKNEIIQSNITNDIKIAPIPKKEIDLIREYKQEENDKKREAEAQTTESQSTETTTVESTELEGTETEKTEEGATSTTASDPAVVTDKVVVKDIRDTATERYSSSVLASPHLKDNFVNTYNSKILPLINETKEETTQTQSETTENNESTESTTDTPETVETDETVSPAPTESADAMKEPTNDTVGIENK